MKNYIKLASSIAAITASLSVSAGTIDLFTTQQDVSIAGDQTPGATAFSQAADLSTPSSILGGYRDMEVKLVTPDGNPGNTVKMNAFNGYLSFSADAGLTGQGTIQWDGNDNSAALDETGLGGIDFTALGNQFTFDVVNADHAFDFSIGLYDMAGNHTIFDLQATQGTHTTNIAFSFFENAYNTYNSGGCIGPNSLPGNVNSVECVGGPLDLTNIGALEVVIGTNGGVSELDLKIGSVTAVPEPASLALMGLGFLAFGFAGQRKSKKA